MCVCVCTRVRVCTRAITRGITPERRNLGRVPSKMRFHHHRGGGDLKLELFDFLSFLFKIKAVQRSSWGWITYFLLL